VTATRSNPDVPGFEVLESIGDGGLGTVYRARQNALDRLVAIKVLHPHLDSDPGAVERFQKEWKSSASLKHPNIIQVYEAGEHEGRHYFVMEYVEGSSLADYEKSGAKLDDEKALTVAKSIATALNYALQKAGVTHGDLKPSNIMIDSDGTLKVMDFFGAEDESNPYKPSPSESSSIQLTSVGCDIYSLGAILQRLTTGDGPGADAPDPDTKSARLVEALMRRTAGKILETWNDVLEELERESEVRPQAAAQSHSNEAKTQYLARTPRPRTAQTTRRNTTASAPAIQRTKRKSTSDWIGFVVVVWVVGGSAWLLWDKVLREEDATPRAEVGTVDAAPSLPSGPDGKTAMATPPAPSESEPVAGEAAAGDNEAAGEDPEIDPSAERLEHSPPESVDPGQIQMDAEGSSPKEPSSAEFSEYVQLMSALFQQISHRKYRDASALAKSWSQANPDSPYYGKIQDSLQRIEQVEMLSSIFFENRENLINTSLRNGTIQSIKPDAFMVQEQRGSSKISLDVAVASLTNREFMRLLKRADEEQFTRNGTIYLLSHREFQRGRQLMNQIPTSSADAAMLGSWLHDWESVHRNLLANEALNTVASLVRRRNYSQAERAMVEAMDAYRDTDVFAWFRRDEVGHLNSEILQGTLASSSPPKRTSAASKTKTDAGPLLTNVTKLNRPPQLELKINRIKNERQGNHRHSLHTQDVEMHVSLENKEVQTGFENLKFKIYAVAEELRIKGRYKLLIKDSDEFTLPIRGSHEYISESVHLNFHEYGNYKWGFKYYGYLCVLYDGDGNVVLTKSSKPKLEKNQEKFTELVENQEFSM